MKIKSAIGLAVGPVNDAHWGQVLVLPHSYGIIEILDEHGNAQQLGIGALSRLGEALSRDLTSLRMIEEVADKVLTASIKSLVILVPVGRVVYMVLRGEGNIYVKRGSELASLMHEEGGISGEVREGDTFLLVSHGFSQVLSHEELTKLFDHLAPADVAEKLTLLLHEEQGGEGSVALVYEASQLEETGFMQEPKIPAEKPVETDVPHVSRRMPTVDFTRVKRYIASLRHNPKRMTAVIAVALLSLFTISVLLGIWKQTTAKKNQSIISATADAQLAFDEGVALLSLNPVKGRERLTLAKQLLDPYMSTVSPRSTEGYKLSTLYREITDNLTQAMQIVEVPPAVFYDMSLIKKDAKATYIALDATLVAVGDQATATVYQVDISSKNARIVGGGESVKDLSSVALHGDTFYALTQEGVVQFRSSDKKSSLVVKREDAWGTISSLVSFGGNLYLLDTSKSRIWKYVAAEKGFSEMREYLNPDTLPDLSGATGMAIDGSIWLGTTHGKILRFTQGKENSYIPKGVDPAFGTNLSVYTSDSVKNVYVLDSQNNRVVVLDKEGMYLAQYRWTGAVIPSQLVVSEGEKKILLVADGKIYSIDLK